MSLEQFFARENTITPYQFPDLIIEKHDEFYVVRDDLLEGGSKVRFGDFMVKNLPYKVFAYGGSNKVGWGNISLAYLCRKYGKHAVSFYAARKVPTAHQEKYLEYGGEIRWVKMGMLSVTKAHAKWFVEENPEERMNVPIGLEHDSVFGSIIKVARNIDVVPDVVWTVGSSGTLSRGLQMAWPYAEFHCIQTGHGMDQEEAGKAIVHPVKYKFDQAVRKKEELPPFPSAKEYDAKVWKPMMELHDPNKINLFWNVAGDL